MTKETDQTDHIFKALDAVENMSKHAPTPYELHYSQVPTNNNSYHVYLSANGKKIAAIWGGNEQKSFTAEFIVQACNAHDDLLAALAAVISSGHWSIDHDRNRTPESIALRAKVCAAIDKAKAVQS